MFKNQSIRRDVFAIPDKDMILIVFAPTKIDKQVIELRWRSDIDIAQVFQGMIESIDHIKTSAVLAKQSAFFKGLAP